MRLWHIFLAVLGIVLCGGVLFYAITHPVAHPDLTSSLAAPSPAGTTGTTPAERIAPQGFKEYHNLTYHFSLFYPETLVMKEYKEVGTALTVTFQATDGSNQGFQIFVVPYGEKTISAARLKQDIPSGVVEEQTQIVLDGKPATMFYSKNAILGETREVWFINHGFLYEVTTYKALDTWLAEVMQTWKFF